MRRTARCLGLFEYQALIGLSEAPGGRTMRMREVGHADKAVNDRYTPPAGAGE